MKSMVLRAIALILCVSTLLLSSCIKINGPSSDEAETTTDDTTDAQSETDYDYVIVENDFLKEQRYYLNSLGNADFEGSTVLIATPSPALIDEDSALPAMSKEIEYRKRDLKNKFNVELASKTVDPDTLYTSVYNACLANDYFADLLMIPQYYILQYVTSGILFNMNSLPFTDFDSGYNIETGTEAAQALSSAWAVASWTTLDPGGLPAVFFNKELASECGLEDPYKLVKNGKWTWDAFFEYCEALDGLNEKRNAEGLAAVRSYGAQNTSVVLSDIVYFSEGNRFVTAGLGNYPAIALDPAASGHTAGTLQRLFNDANKETNAIGAIDAFASGSSLFLIDRLETMKSIAASDAVWGVLPIPKKDTEQEKYISLAPSDTLFFAIPANCTGSEKVSRTMSCLNVLSLGYCVDAYLTDSMYYYLRDNESISSVEKICYGVTYDMAYTAGSYDDAIPNSTYFAIRNVYENNHEVSFYTDAYSYAASAALTRLFS
ncbi:MAG: hypothetical protein IJT70_07065 [Clostridia bacterium]|nr:hypothetical protein [Clostridia bacterium]